MMSWNAPGNTGAAFFATHTRAIPLFFVHRISVQIGGFKLKEVTGECSLIDPLKASLHLSLSKSPCPMH
jgi:hypothetical protein